MKSGHEKNHHHGVLDSKQRNLFPAAAILSLLIILLPSIFFSCSKAATRVVPAKAARQRPPKASPSKSYLIGSVKDKDTQEPLDGVLAQYDSEETQTDENGLFELTGLKRSELALDLSKPYYQNLHTLVDIKPGRNEADFYLSSSLTEAELDSPHTPIAPQVIRKGNPHRKQVAITLDDGWNVDYRILDLLEQNSIAITVFIIGDRGVADKHPDFIRRMDKDGWEVATHGYTHYITTNMSNAQLAQEILKGQEIISRITHKRYSYYRPSGGTYSQRTLKVISAIGYKTILWSIDSLDTRKGLTTEQRLNQILPNLHNGAIILFHFGGYNTYELLSELIPELKNRDYEVTTISEILKP